MELEMSYSVGFRQKMLSKMCGPGRVTASELSRQTDVPQQTLSRWLRDAKLYGMTNSSNKEKGTPRRPCDWNAEQRLEAVAQAASMNEDELGAFLRRSGLKSADLDRWKASMLKAVQPEALRRTKRRKSEEQKRILSLEKELRRKDKALAETAALLILKKKAQEIWGDPDDGTA